MTSTSDLRNRITLASVVVGDRERSLVASVLDSGSLAQGPMVADLEQRIASTCGTAHAIAVNNGTTALLAALAAAGVGPGDEVVLPALTFGATLNAVIATGATARIADVSPDYTIDPQSVVERLTERTRVLLPVHLYGLPADMPTISDLAIEHSLKIVEDNAQAIGAAIDDRPTGSWGYGCLSLYATKNVAAGEGGAVTTDDPEIAATLRALRNQGMTERYEYSMTGLNWRMTDLHAAIGVGQIERLEATTSARRTNAATLDSALSDVPWLETPPRVDGRSHVHHQYVVSVRPDAPGHRQDLIEHLDRAGIDAAPVYPRSVHDYPCFRTHPLVVDDPTPHADAVAATVVSLPVHPSLSETDLDRISSAVADFGR